MKFSWIFGSSMGAHHLLLAYLSVWLIQGGYACWVVWQWMHTKRSSPPVDPLASENHDS